MSLLSLYGQWFSRYRPIFKLPYRAFGYETWPLAKVPEVTHILSLNPKWKSLFLLYGQQFPLYGQFFKIAIFGHETWSLTKYPAVPRILPFYPKGAKSRAKVQEVAHIPSFYPRGAKFSLFSLYGQWFWDTGQFSKLSCLGMKLSHPEVAHIFSFYPRESKLSLFLLYGQRFPR